VDCFNSKKWWHPALTLRSSNDNDNTINNCGEILPSQYWIDVYQQKDASVPWDVGGPQRQIVKVAKKGLFRGRSVLDCGCGTGDNAAFLLGEDGGASSVVGFDISPHAVKAAQQRCQDIGGGDRVRFHVASCTSLEDMTSLLPVADFSPSPLLFDIVLDSALLHCLSDVDAEAYVQNLSNLVNPNGGMLLLGCFSDQNRDPWSNPRRLSETRLRELLSSFGSFDIQSIESCWWSRPDDRGSNQGSFCLAWWCVATRC